MVSTQIYRWINTLEFIIFPYNTSQFKKAGVFLNCFPKKQVNVWCGKLQENYFFFVFRQRNLHFVEMYDFGGLGYPQFRESGQHNFFLWSRARCTRRVRVSSKKTLTFLWKIAIAFSFTSVQLYIPAFIFL